jgi:hypothetical protein
MKKQHDPADTSVLPAYVLLVPSRVPHLHVIYFFFSFQFSDHSLFLKTSKFARAMHKKLSLDADLDFSCSDMSMLKISA